MRRTKPPHLKAALSEAYGAFTPDFPEVRADDRTLSIADWSACALDIRRAGASGTRHALHESRNVVHFQYISAIASNPIAELAGHGAVRGGLIKG